MKMEDIAVRAVLALTAGFFWLAIMRFLSSYDAHMAIQERTAQELNQLQQTSESWLTSHEMRLNLIEQRVKSLEEKLGIPSMVINEI